MGLHRLLGFRVGVPDPEGLAGFYGEVGLGHDGNGGFAGTDGGTQVTVDHHAFRRLLQVDVAVDSQEDLDAAAGRLRAGGADPVVADGQLSVVEPVNRVTFRLQVAPRWHQPVVAEALGDNRPGVTPRRNARAAGTAVRPRPPRRLGHLMLATPDVARTGEFLVDGLGFRVSDEIPGFIAFTRCSTDHHNLGLVSGRVPHLQHYSWECDDVDHVGHTASALVRADQDRHVWGFGRHFVGSNYYWYVRDAAGTFCEFYSDMDLIDDEDEWVRTRTPVTAEVVAASWGHSLPAEFIEPNDIADLQAGWAQLA